MPMSKQNLSIRATLLLWLLPLMAAFMLLAWFIHGVLLERMTRDFVHDRLQQEALFLQKQVNELYPQVDPMLTAGPYFEDVFHHAFAIQVGEQAFVSPDPLRPLLAPLLAEPSTDFLNLDFESRQYLAYRKSLVIDETPAVIVVAEDLSGLNGSQSELHAWTAFVALGLLVILILLVLLAVSLALKPVRQLRHSLQELQAGHEARLNLNAPREFVPLITQINRLLDMLDQRLQRSRDALANLSHSVKTPIAAIQQVLQNTERPLDSDYRLRLANRLSDIDRQLESEMRRSQFAGPQVGKLAHPVKQARDMVWMVGRLYRHISFELQTALESEFKWPIEEHDLNEMLGNVLDNAGKWARASVNLALLMVNDTLIIRITDDGPGVAPHERENLGTRGLRLDQQTPGHGLGLAIVRDLVDRYGGTVEFNDARSGGLEVRISLPMPARKEV
ncbi:sensor histidine kinase [Marinobacter fonticola]|uniref:sensor histidine kinase n=1 Tax=Marinobacter fonticola TaxID=2603215 RepID=UPI0011E7D8BE|nr:sensor histidine kinase [Marinobacter fonticola]